MTESIEDRFAELMRAALAMQPGIADALNRAGYVPSGPCAVALLMVAVSGIKSSPRPVSCEAWTAMAAHVYDSICVSSEGIDSAFVRGGTA